MSSLSVCREALCVASNSAQQVEGHECHQHFRAAADGLVFSRAVVLRGVRNDLANLLARVVAVSGNLPAKKLQPLQHAWVRCGQRVGLEQRFDLVSDFQYPV